MRKIKNFISIFAIIFAIFPGMWREPDFVGVADVIDDTLVEVGGEEFLLESNLNNKTNTTDSSVGNSDIESSKNGRIFIEKNFVDNNLLKISVYAEDVFSPVIGVSFHLKYDAKKVSFVKYEAGDFLEAGGKPFYLVKDSRNKNKIYFGETLKKGDFFPTQGGKIVDFYFKISDYVTTGDSNNGGSIGTQNSSVTSDKLDPNAEINSKILFSFLNGNVSTMDNGAEIVKNIKFENSEIDLLEKDGLSNSIASVFENFNFLNNKIFLGVLIGAGIFGGLTLALFLAFKYGKKRAEVSVNFK